MSDTILIVGRGPSVHTFDWTSVDCPVLAVSSGIFALPRSIHCDHFVSLDEPKYYMAQLMAQCPGSWGNDPKSRYWPFWADASIVKHVVGARIRHIEAPLLPLDIITKAVKARMAVTGEHEELRLVLDAIYREVGSNLANFGLQPGWGDYQNVRGWEVKALRYPRWEDGPIAIHRVYNSLLFAVQVATRLGFRTLKFIGVDLSEEGFASVAKIMRDWHGHAARRGYEWINLGQTSIAGDVIPRPQHSTLEIAA